MTKRQFVLVVVDPDTGEFTVEGPMRDDRLWNSAVVNAQKVGRNIRCFREDIAPDVAASGWRSSYGGRRIASGSIVWASQPKTGMPARWPQLLPGAGKTAIGPSATHCCPVN
jgi:hypothetical protein